MLYGQPGWAQDVVVVEVWRWWKRHRWLPYMSVFQDALLRLILHRFRDKHRGVVTGQELLLGGGAGCRLIE